MADADPARATPTGKKEATPAQRAFHRKVRREAYLTSGFENESEKTRVVEAFYSVVWPQLEEIGWRKLDDGEKIRFESSDRDVVLERIFDIISHIKSKRSFAEISKAFKATLNGSIESEETFTRRPRLQASSSPPPHGRKLPKSILPSPPSSPNTLAWKFAGREFPRRCSQIGPQHQATKIPKAGTLMEEGELSSAVLIWSPKQAGSKGLSMEAADTLLNQVPKNVKEPALFMLADKDYDAQAFQESATTLLPTDGSDWSEARMTHFRNELFRQRKDIAGVAKIMGVSVQTAYNVYLARFKFSDDYRLLKVIMQEEFTQRNEFYEHEVDQCVICGDGGNLLICDGCEGEYHMECVRPPLQKVPEGSWECDECVDKRLLTARDLLVRTTGLFQLMDNKKVDVNTTPPMKRAKLQHSVYEPLDEVITTCRNMALTICEALRGVADANEATQAVDVSANVESL